MSNQINDSQNSKNSLDFDNATINEQIKNYLGISFVSDCLKEVYNFAQENFKIFSSILVAILTIGIWFIRAIGYCYQAGIFSIYNISKCYIEINNNFLLQMVQALATLIILMLSNYIYIYLSLRTDTSKYHIKRIRNKIVFLVFEMMTILLIVLIQGNSNVIDIYNEFKFYTLSNYGFLFTILIICSLLINVFGIETIHYIKKEQKKKKDESHVPDKKNNIKQVSTYFITSLILAAILLSGSYFIGIIEEYDRTNYKIIEKKITDCDNLDSEYTFIKENSSVKYEVYPVIYENENIYIVTRMHRDGNNIEIEREYQKIIKKQNIEVFTYDKNFYIKKLLIYNAINNY